MAPLLALLSLLTADATRLQWSAPPSCPDRAQAQRWVEEALAGREATVDAAVTLAPTGAGWVARLDTGGPPRTLEDPDCEALAQAVALVLAVDAVAAEQAPAVPEPPLPEPTQSPARQEPTTPSQRQPVEPARVPPPVTDSRPPIGLQHRVGILGGVAWGPVPAAAGAVGLRYRLGVNRWELGVDGLYQPPRTLRYPDGVAGGVFQSASASASGCAILGPVRVRVPLCLGAEAGVVIAEGVDAFETRLASEPWVSTRLEAGVRGQITQRLELGFEAQGGLVHLRPAFNIGERAPLTRTPRLLARGLVALFWRLR